MQGLLSGSSSDKSIGYPHRLTHNTHRGEVQAYATAKGWKSLASPKWALLTSDVKICTSVPKPVVLMNRKVRVFCSSTLVHDVIELGLSIVCLSRSAYIDLTRWEPHAYHLLQNVYEGVSLMCKLTILSWLPWSPICKVQKIFLSLCSIYLRNHNFKVWTQSPSASITTWLTVMPATPSNRF